jgi:hypothetical protein
MKDPTATPDMRSHEREGVSTRSQGGRKGISAEINNSTAPAEINNSTAPSSSKTHQDFQTHLEDLQSERHSKFP